MSHQPGRLFVTGGGEITCQEGTPQGDPLSRVFYAITILPIINHLQAQHNLVHRIWYTNDSSVVALLQQLRDWWEELVRISREYGYYPNADKALPQVKPDHALEASDIFDGTGMSRMVQITLALPSVHTNSSVALHTSTPTIGGVNSSA